MDVSSDELNQLNRFVELFLAKNQELNLTKVEDSTSFLIKHIVDSVYLNESANIKSGMKVADLGTGGGLPGIVLAIMNPKAEFVLVDSVQKKITAVEGFASNLKLNNVTGVSDRLEALGLFGHWLENRRSLWPSQPTRTLSRWSLRSRTRQDQPRWPQQHDPPGQGRQPRRVRCGLDHIRNGFRRRRLLGRFVVLDAVDPNR